jgi:hypothetical protein
MSDLPPTPEQMEGLTKKAIICQSIGRKYLCRKYLRSLKDGMTFSTLNKCIAVYKDTITNEKKINKSLKNKKIRLSNCPSHITENLAKFAIVRKYGIMPTWDTDKGDLSMKLPSKKIEVKGSLNFANGPATFGPTENWDIIYFVDCVKFMDNIYTIYEIKLSNISEVWKNIKVSKKQTFHDQCKQQRRPHIKFKKLKHQLGNYCKLIFDGHISVLNPTTSE